MNKNLRPIGVFDSGVGGISVLRKLVEILPNEDFIYFGDSLNAPYGTKTHEQILHFTQKNISGLVGDGVKAIVVACNTATSVCIDVLRSDYPDIPIVGIEPALKPAVLSGENSDIVVMATPLTLKEKKFALLCEKYKASANIMLLPCPGLMELVESGIFCGEKLESYLTELFNNAGIKSADSVVLGCTHYPFVKDTVSKLLNGAKIFDGGEGTARQLKKLLASKNLLNDSNIPGKIEFRNSKSGSRETDLCKKLMKLQTN